MTYAAFHLVFILPPIAGLAVAYARQRPPEPHRVGVAWIAGIALIAFVYTIPWDNYLVYREVWSYGADRVLAVIGYVPIEEYAFFVLQPILTGLWLMVVRSSRLVPEDPVASPGRVRVGMTVFWLAITVIGVALWAAGGHALYLGLILAWCGPILTGMAWIGGDRFWAQRRLWLVAVGIPTVYLWVADRTAIDLGIWDIADATSLGWDPLGLPIEEAVFFLVTNIMVVQGLLLFLQRRIDKQ